MSRDIRFTRKEDDRCRQVIELFSGLVEEKENFCIARAEGYGYIVLYDITDGYFESSQICPQAETLFGELLRVWEVEYLFRIGSEHDCPDFEASEEAMNEEQRACWEETRSAYRQAMEKILQH